MQDNGVLLLRKRLRPLGEPGALTPHSHLRLDAGVDLRRDGDAQVFCSPQFHVHALRAARLVTVDGSP